jgi:NADPH2:quinone reductase
MRAVRRLRPGIAEVSDIPTPGPDSVREDEVVLDVLYAGLNPVDMHVLRGEIGGDKLLTMGAEATGLLGGQPVQVSGAGLGASRDGTFAERVVVPKSAV